MVEVGSDGRRDQGGAWPPRRTSAASPTKVMLTLVRHGDVDAFALLYDRHAAAGFSLAYRMTGDRAVGRCCRTPSCRQRPRALLARARERPRVGAGHRAQPRDRLPTPVKRARAPPRIGRGHRGAARGPRAHRRRGRSPGGGAHAAGAPRRPARRAGQGDRVGLLRGLHPHADRRDARHAGGDRGAVSTAGPREDAARAGRGRFMGGRGPSSRIRRQAGTGSPSKGGHPACGWRSLSDEPRARPHRRGRARMGAPSARARGRAREAPSGGCPVCRADAERLRRSVDLLPRALEPVSPRPEVRAGGSCGSCARAPCAARGPGGRRPEASPATPPAPPTLAAASAVLAVGVAAGLLAGRLAAPDPPRVVAAQVDASRLPGASASLVLPGETGSVPVLRLQGLERPAPTASTRCGCCAVEARPLVGVHPPHGRHGGGGDTRVAGRRRRRARDPGAPEERGPPASRSCACPCRPGRAGSPGYAGRVESCYRHPGRETGVSCSNCGRPICPDCMTPTSVGMRCPECSRQTTKVRTARDLHAEPRLTGADRRQRGPAVRRDAERARPLRGGRGSSRWARCRVPRWPTASSGAWSPRGSCTRGPPPLLQHVLYLSLGGMLEPVIGKLRFALIYFVSLLAGSFGALLLEPFGRTVGASGAIFGLMGAAIVVMRARGISPMESGLGLWIGLNLLITFTVPNISIGGHVGVPRRHGGGVRAVRPAHPRPRLGGARQRARGGPGRAGRDGVGPRLGCLKSAAAPASVEGPRMSDDEPRSSQRRSAPRA